MPIPNQNEINRINLKLEDLEAKCILRCQNLHVLKSAIACPSLGFSSGLRRGLGFLFGGGGGFKAPGARDTSELPHLEASAVAVEG